MKDGLSTMHFVPDRPDAAVFGLLRRALLCAAALLPIVWSRPHLLEARRGGGPSGREFVRKYEALWGTRWPYAPFAPGCASPCWRADESTQWGGPGEASPRFRCLPLVYVCGVRKCGTSSIVDALVTSWSQAMLLLEARSNVTAAGRSHAVTAAPLSRGADGCTGGPVKETHFMNVMASCLQRGDRECSRLDARFQCEPHININESYAGLLSNADPLRRTSRFFVSKSCHAHFVDGSPSACYKPDILSALVALTPRARLIISLRHPPARLWSDYLFSHKVSCGMKRTSKLQRAGFELDCADRLDAQRQRFHRSIRIGMRPPNDLTSLEMFSAGIYHIVLRKLRTAVLVVRLEDWQLDPAHFAASIIAYVGHDDDAEWAEKMRTTAELVRIGKLGAGVSRVVSTTHGKRNTSTGASKSTAMLPATACLLEQAYAPHNVQLAGLLDDDDAYLWRDVAPQDCT